MKLHFFSFNEIKNTREETGMLQAWDWGGNPFVWKTRLRAGSFRIAPICHSEIFADIMKSSLVTRSGVNMADLAASLFQI